MAKVEKHLLATTIPITEDREAIAEALEDANTAALIMSIEHMTGDASILQGSIKPKMINVVEEGEASAKGELQ